MNKDQYVFFLDYILSYLHFIVSYCGYIKMAENKASAEYNPDGKSDFQGCNNENTGDNGSIVQDSDPDSSDNELSLVESVSFYERYIFIDIILKTLPQLLLL